MLVYGGLIHSNNMKKYISLPNKLKLFRKFDATKEEVQTESEALESRWDDMGRIERSFSDNSISNENLRK